jgi:hypothetical protein
LAILLDENVAARAFGDFAAFVQEEYIVFASLERFFVLQIEKTAAGRFVAQEAVAR